ncbi:hypothetical protein LTS10_011640 [Elasticomyces elasticus]|nr:hypothetical protein LTS10_011640 [Elasticomyces elasticus]
MSTNSIQQLASLSDWQPKTSFVRLDEFWFRATSLNVFKEGFHWDLTPWLAPQLELDIRTRYRLTRAIGDDGLPENAFGTFYFGSSEPAGNRFYPAWTLYLVFPRINTNLADSETLAEMFHDQILRKAYEECRLPGGGRSVPNRKLAKLESEAYRIEYMHPEAMDESISCHVHTNLVDVDRFWGMVKEGIDTDRRFECLKGVFLAVVWGSRNGSGSAQSRDRVWEQTMRYDGKAIDMQFVVQDTLHAAFQDVSVATRRAESNFLFFS